MNATQELYGCDELREWLTAQGFRVAHDDLNRDNECNWYAYRRIALPARECECNTGKPNDSPNQTIECPWVVVGPKGIYWIGHVRGGDS